MAAWTKATLLAGEGDEHLVSAVGAADAGEAEVQVAATEEPAGDFADDRSPRTECLGVTRAVGALELGEVTLDGPVQRRTSRLAWPVDGCGLLAETDHGTPLFGLSAERGRYKPWILVV